MDIALLPTLARRGNIKDLTAGYGVVVADKCHHIAASVFFNVISEYLPNTGSGSPPHPNAATGLKTSSITNSDHIT